MVVIGQTLFTKDGRSFGNATVVAEIEIEGEQFFQLRTDFGNFIVMTFPEIEEGFHTARYDGIEQVCDLTQKLNDQLIKLELAAHYLRR